MGSFLATAGPKAARLMLEMFRRRDEKGGTYLGIQEGMGPGPEAARLMLENPFNFLLPSPAPGNVA